MRKLSLAIPLILSFCGATAAPAQTLNLFQGISPEHCVTRSYGVDKLTLQYKEKVVNSMTNQQGYIVEVWESQELGTWSNTVTIDSIMCLLYAGLLNTKA
jgi:hypothetical protein